MIKTPTDDNIVNITGQYVDIYHKVIYPAEISVRNGRIAAITPLKSAPTRFILPGFIDAHIHIESSLLVPSEFARLAVLHGTVATVSDPHEIANVCGMEGVNYMIENGNSVNFKFYFGAPSCVPATTFETAGATIGVSEIAKLMSDKRIHYLAEMMNWPGVIYRDETITQKIEWAKKAGKPIDGHAPGLTGDRAKAYIQAGMSTDHECFTYEEAAYKIQLGMKIAIREGSAAKNFDALINLMDKYPESLMFCSDDKHPDSLLEGHINQLVARAIKLGKNVFDVLQAACINPVNHYGLEVGTLRKGDPADFIVVEDLKEFSVQSTYINGLVVSNLHDTLIPSVKTETINQFAVGPIQEASLRVNDEGKAVRVIVAEEGQLVTKQDWATLSPSGGNLISDTTQDVLKLAVVNRYKKAPPAVAFIKNFGLKRGAIASSVAHDSHNIVVVGANDRSMTEAVNAIISQKGGLSLCDGENCKILPLPVAGLMTTEDAFITAARYTELDRLAKERLGCTLASPYMTLSFMALLVIPDLKLSDKGLFDGNSFNFVPLYNDLI
ncbi:MAG: adenine deaminase [Lunatimonas sp.]|uniref:adenine deaminase n=1 Tax=Lunatimonas sp. TaxID=2060141 RepID=UPI00263A69A5|nr:adenine deaminase [Lunatimonas sp.]MCC5936100.1 adenine deaminase [Lunatimonas sp.]